MDKISSEGIKPKIRFIRLPEVISRTAYGRTSIYRKMKDATFPKCLKLGGPPADNNKFDCRAIAWVEDDVDQWIEAVVMQSNSGHYIIFRKNYLERKKWNPMLTIGDRYRYTYRYWYG